MLTSRSQAQHSPTLLERSTACPHVALAAMTVDTAATSTIFDFDELEKVDLRHPTTERVQNLGSPVASLDMNGSVRSSFCADSALRLEFQKLQSLHKAYAKIDLTNGSCHRAKQSEDPKQEEEPLESAEPGFLRDGRK